jgi:hypothetical protein
MAQFVKDNLFTPGLCRGIPKRLQHLDVVIYSVYTGSNRIDVTRGLGYELNVNIKGSFIGSTLLYSVELEVLYIGGKG